MTSWEEVKEMAQGKGGFARTKWCGSLECELAMKEKAGVSSRCMPLKQSGTTGKCVDVYKRQVIDVEDYNLDKFEPDLWAIKGLAASLLPVIREFYTHEENVQ